jgi:hypothetical protein
MKFNSEKKAARGLYFFFLFTSVSSFLYALIRGKLNGDFLGVEVTISVWLLLINLVFTLLPFYILWKFYCYFKNKQKLFDNAFHLKNFSIFLFTIIFLNIIVTLLYGVGIMAAPNYEAPGYIKPFIQILNRFSYTYGSFIYIIAVPKKNKTQIALVILLIFLSYLRAGLGIFLYLAMLFYLKYFNEVFKIFKKHLLVVILILFTTPFIVTFLLTSRCVGWEVGWKVGWEEGFDSGCCEGCKVG